MIKLKTSLANAPNGVLLFVLGSFIIATVSCKDAKRKAQSAPVNIIAVTASSTLAPTKNYNYAATHALDSYMHSSWVEGRADDGVGEFLTVKLAQEADLSSFSIINGFGVRQYWSQNNRVHMLQIEAGGETREVNLKDQFLPQVVALPKALKGKEFRFIIRSVYPGSKYKDTAIADISVPGWIKPSTAEPGALCNVAGYITANPADLFKEPAGQKLTTLKSREIPLSVTVIESRGGWLRITNIEEFNNKIPYSGWLKVGQVSTGLGNHEINFYSKPDLNAPVSATFDADVGAGYNGKILDCSGNFVQFNEEYQGKKYSGWLHSGNLCASPETTCIGG